MHDTTTLFSTGGRGNKQRITGVFLVDREKGKEYSLYVDETKIGRDAALNDIVLVNDSSISREHCKIKAFHGRFTLYDLASRSGTQVNGEWVRNQCVLHDNDRIIIGDTVLDVILPNR